MTQPLVFPAFIKAQLDGNNVFAEFERKAAAAADNVERHFKGSLDEVSRITQRALSQPLNASGALDLGVGEMRQAAAAADQRARALRQVAEAAGAVAQRELTLTGAQQAQTAAAYAAAAAAEREALTAREKVTTYEILQRELNETAQATARLTGVSNAAAIANTRAAVSIGQQRAGMQQLSFQIGDVSQQLALGINPAVVFGQQFGQIAQAIQLTTGATRGFVGFIGGPYGAILTGIITATALFATKTNEATAATTTAKTAADALGSAQSALAEMFDLSTGRIVRNTEALRLNIIMQAEQLRASAIAQRQAGYRTLNRAGDYSWASTARDILGANFNLSTGQFEGGDQRARVQSEAVGQLMQRVARARQLPAGRERDQELNRLLVALSRLDTSRLAVSGRELGQAGVDIVNADDIERTASDMLRSATTGNLANSLRRPQTGSRGSRGASAGALAEFGEDASRRIANITARFRETPPVIEAARRAMGELDDVASDLERRRPPKFEAMVTQIAAARTEIEASLSGPFREWTEEQDRQRQLQTLINQGRSEEAEILEATYRLSQQQGKVTEEQTAEIRRRITLRAEEARQAEIERQRQQAYLQNISQVRAGLEDAIANLNTRGLRGLGDVASAIYGGFRQLTASSVVENLFGGAFRDLEDYATGRGRVREANEDLADSSDIVTNRFERLAEAAETAADAISGGGTGGGGEKAMGGALKGLADAMKQAADDTAEIVVTGRRRTGAEGGMADLSPRDFTIRTISGLLGPLGLDERLTRRISAGVTDAMQGAFIGQSAASLILGGRGSSTGAAIGGALGEFAGQALGKELGSLLGSLGSAAGPIGSIVGGIAGSLLGGVLTSTPRASSTIGGVNGQLAITGTAGTNRLRGASIEAADSVIANVQRIAELFGANVDASRGSVSIGLRKDTYRVDTSGRGITKLSKGATEYQDAESAVRAAVLDLIRDGVITGLRQGTQRLLQSGKDLDSAVQKALDFEGVFKSLKERLDPVGAALDALDQKFSGLQRTFAEAGASAEDLAALEKLYGLERADAVREATERVTGSLRSLLDDLTVGNSVLSLRERYSLAQAKLAPLADRVAAGDRTANDEFAEASRLVIDLARQIFGSQTGYFDERDRILGITSAAIDRENALIEGATGRPPLMGGSGSEPVVSAIDRLGDRIVGALEDRLGARMDTLIGNQVSGLRGGGGGGSAMAGNWATNKWQF